MALATFRNTETGELIELSEDWPKRFPNDPYELVTGEDLEKAEVEHRQATAAAVGAQEYQQPDAYEEQPVEEPTPAASGKPNTDAGDTQPPAPDHRSDSRF